MAAVASRRLPGLQPSSPLFRSPAGAAGASAPRGHTVSFAWRKSWLSIFGEAPFYLVADPAKALYRAYAPRRASTLSSSPGLAGHLPRRARLSLPVPIERGSTDVGHVPVMIVI